MPKASGPKLFRRVKMKSSTKKARNARRVNRKGGSKVKSS